MKRRRGRFPVRVIELDVGHRRLAAWEAVEEVHKAIAKLRRVPGPAVLKVIHGRGREPGGGIIRREVREYLERLGEVRAVIRGEDYDKLDALTIEMRTACDHFPDSDLDRCNAGMTLVWVR